MSSNCWQHFFFRSYKLGFETSERLLMLFTLNAGENLQTQMCALKQLSFEDCCVKLKAQV